MKPKIISISLLCAVFAADVAFADTVIKAEVDKVKITTDQVINYKLTIKSSEKQVAEPNLPEFKGFSILSQSQSSQISIGKNGMETVVVYAFMLAPPAPGKFSIPPAEIKINGKSYASERFEIEVTLGKGAPKTSPEERPSPPGEYPAESEESQYTI